MRARRGLFLNKLSEEEETLILAQPPKKPKIRCPKCWWKPLKSSRWYCSHLRCGHEWNTFDTGGKCPKCSYQWRDTACLKCHKWSPHEDWYVTDPRTLH